MENNVKAIKTENKKLTTKDTEIANAFVDYFTIIGVSMAQKFKNKDAIFSDCSRNLRSQCFFFHKYRGVT